MGVIRNLAKKRKEKKAARKLAESAASTAILTALKKVLIGVLLILTIGGFFTWLIEEITAEETPKTTYEELEVTDLKELIEIKGNALTGYYLEFVEDIDDRLDKLIEVSSRREGNRSFTTKDKSMIKQMIKAEAVTQFPNLGGKIDEDNENQFQGAVTIRRVTPDKKIGEMKSTGAGEKTTLDDLKEEEKEEEDITYEKGQELTVKGTVMVYLKGDYNFLGNKQSEDGVTPKISTMYSRIEGINNSVYIAKGKKVYYTGNEYFYENNTYIEVTEEKEASEITRIHKKNKYKK